MRAARRPGQRIVGWTLFFLWAMSLAGLQGLLTRDSAASFVPDVALVLSVVVLARAEAGDLGLIDPETVAAMLDHTDHIGKMIRRLVQHMQPSG